MSILFLKYFICLNVISLFHQNFAANAVTVSKLEISEFLTDIRQQYNIFGETLMWMQSYQYIEQKPRRQLKNIPYNIDLNSLLSPFKTKRCHIVVNNFQGIDSTTAFNYPWITRDPN